MIDILLHPTNHPLLRTATRLEMPPKSTYTAVGCKHLFHEEVHNLYVSPHLDLRPRMTLFAQLPWATNAISSNGRLSEWVQTRKGLVPPSDTSVEEGIVVPYFKSSACSEAIASAPLNSNALAQHSQSGPLPKVTNYAPKFE